MLLKREIVLEMLCFIRMSCLLLGTSKYILCHLSLWPLQAVLLLTKLRRSLVFPKKHIFLFFMVMLTSMVCRHNGSMGIGCIPCSSYAEREWDSKKPAYCSQYGQCAALSFASSHRFRDCWESVWVYLLAMKLWRWLFVLSFLGAELFYQMEEYMCIQIVHDMYLRSVCVRCLGPLLIHYVFAAVALTIGTYASCVKVGRDF